MMGVHKIKNGDWVSRILDALMTPGVISMIMYVTWQKELCRGKKGY